MHFIFKGHIQQACIYSIPSWTHNNISELPVQLFYLPVRTQSKI